MASREDVETWLQATLKTLGGKGRVAQICKEVRARYETELRQSGDLFYAWQYDIRWAANRLRRRKIMKSVEISPAGLWELA
jgi:hypothetical protein